MKSLLVSLFFCGIVTSGIEVKAQTNSSIEQQYDLLTAQWLELSGNLKTYQGLNTFCTSPEYRTSSIEVLGHLHHFDSLVLDLMKEHQGEFAISHKEFKATLKDIEKFETEYGIKAFITVLKGCCDSRRDLERHKKELVNEIGANSYDGQILILENYLRKFLHHIDKKVLAIDDHLHMIHPDQVKPSKGVVSNY